MERWHLPLLGRREIPGKLSTFELREFFSFTSADLQAIFRRRRRLNRLGIAVQIGFLRMTGQTLNAYGRVPPQVWKYLEEQLGVSVPILATPRALYPRPRTLYEHRRAAIALNRFSEMPEAATPSLVAHLRHEALAGSTVGGLVQAARVWQYERRYLVHGDRFLTRLARATLKRQEIALADDVARAVDVDTRGLWRSSLLERSPREGMTVLEWLQEAPRGRSAAELDVQLAKRTSLAALGADRLALPTVSPARLDAYARRISERRPATLPTRTSPRTTATLACFIRQQWLQATDTSIDLADRLITDARRRAGERALATEPARHRDLRKLIGEVWEVLSDNHLEPAEAVVRARRLLEPVVRGTTESRAALARRALANGHEVRPLLEALATFDVGTADSSPLAAALPFWRRLREEGAIRLPEDAPAGLARCWRPLTGQHDRRAALLGYEAALLMTLQRGLRNGTAHVADSRKYRDLDALLIPAPEWSAHRGRSFRRLGLPQSAAKHLKGIKAALGEALRRLSAAVDAGHVRIRNGRVLVETRGRLPRPSNVVATRRKVYQSLIDVQLPDVVLEVDSETRFSWQLLGRSPHGDAELVTLYAALLAHGSDLSAAEVVRMVPGMNADQVSNRMRRLEQEELLRKANEVVLNYLRSHSISRVWGRGLAASADMMSLDATRYLWMARMDPRRRTPAVGTYTHVLDRGGIVYDQPIVLNKRQAGAAIEGALRQRMSSIQRVAVDTHGFTHVAMCVAKHVGLDLCPRLADLADRKLYLPKGFTAPPGLRDICASTVPLRAIERGWDSIVRIAASIDGGWCSPIQVLDKLGSGATGLPVYEAANALGKLYRTLYLCDYWTNGEFRQQILDLLNQGESVHSLQRALHNGLITAKRGRAATELIAISGSLALLTNIVMAYNTSRMDALFHKYPDDFDPRAMHYVAPIGHAHINLRGTLSFDVDRFRDQLFTAPRPRRAA